MKTGLFSAVTAGLFAAVGASPIYNGVPKSVDITFTGGPARFDQTFPTNGLETAIREDLSVSEITGHTDGVYCIFFGVDGSETVVVGARTVPVGPPQALHSGFCNRLQSIQKDTIDTISSLWTASQSVYNGVSKSVDITFTGGPVSFNQIFPTNGLETAIHNDLSVSLITGHTKGVRCIFFGVDGSETVVNGAETVPVGPPQALHSGFCVRILERDVISSPQTASLSVYDGVPKSVDITFTGGPASFNQIFSTNGLETAIRSELSVSQITGYTKGVRCYFFGVDGSETVVNGAETVPVGPPQALHSGFCVRILERDVISSPWTALQSEALSNSQKLKGYRINVELNY